MVKECDFGRTSSAMRWSKGVSYGGISAIAISKEA